MSKAKRIAEWILIGLFIAIVASIASIQIYRSVVNSGWYIEKQDRKNLDQAIDSVNDVDSIKYIKVDDIIVDDTVLCNDPTDGTTYKVLLNDLRITRYVEHEIIKVGDTVQITYEGEMLESNTIDTAISATEVKISGGDVLIPE